MTEEIKGNEKDKPFEYGAANLFRTPVWINLPSDTEVSILITPLTHKTISVSSELSYICQQSAFSITETYQTAIRDSIIDTKNAIGFPDLYKFVQQLTPRDIEYIYEKLLEISIITPEQLKKLGDMMSIQFSPQFRDDSWNCSVCQAKKLDYTRACGYLPKDKRDPAPMLPKINGVRFEQCPISLLDYYILQQASRAYGLLEVGLLPEAGGLGDQTEWFVRAALLYKRKMAEAERDAYEASKNKR